MAKVLIIDDDSSVCGMLSTMVERIGHEATALFTLREGLAQVLSRTFDAVFLDVRMPDGNGLDLLPKIRGAPRPPEVIVMTGAGDPDGAEIAIKNGAWDYLEKPLSPKKIVLSLSRVLQYREGLNKARKSPLVFNREGIVGSSPSIRACLAAVAQAACTEANVLITGETGTGKELFARAIHTNSSRANGNFVVVDCAALPQTLVESSLFGYEKGAFTSADSSKDGLIKQAHRGTLFLDEVGELDFSLQKAFLRVLQERRYRPLGAKLEVESDFRLVAATNRDLHEMVEKGHFRKDLLYRLSATAIDLPALRSRPEDTKDLVLHYVPRICDSYRTATKGIAPDFLDSLCRHHWPGNVRELLHTLEGSVAEAGDEPTLFSKHLPTPIRIQVARASVAAAAKTQGHPEAPASPALAQPQALPAYRDYRETALAEAEHGYLLRLICLTDGSIKDACRISGLGRTRLYTLMKKHGISRYGWRQSPHPAGLSLV